MGNEIRVLVVDDSAFARSTIGARLASDPDIVVVGQARDGIEAVEKTKSLRPNVVTMDVIMPRLDGINAVQQIMTECPTPVVMLSALTAKGSEATIRALEVGAVDFFLKPAVASPAGSEGSTADLVAKIKAAAGARVSGARRPVVAERGAAPAGAKPEKRRSTRLSSVVVIGSSTGGPRALCELLPALPGDMEAAFLIVQHMPGGFTKSLATRLDQLSEVDVKEAQPGDVVTPGVALLAPGGYHMTVASDGAIGLNKDDSECGVRPSVNVTMESVARVYKASSLGVVLTGMGSDGTRGASLIKAARGEIVVEDESTCAVYGMPDSIVRAGHADTILPLPKIAREIIRICGNKSGRGRGTVGARG